MSKCRKYGNFVGLLEIYCDDCIKKITGKKPSKTKKICKRCKHNHRNINREKGCWNYDDAEFTIQLIYTHKTQKYPTPRWRLWCFESKIKK